MADTRIPPRRQAGRGSRRLFARAVPCVLLVSALAGAAWGHSYEERRSWPSSSKRPAATLDRPSLEHRAGDLIPSAAREFRFVVFGDQRALVDGEWQELVRRIALRAKPDSTIRFLVDIGDFVANGKHSDQFWMFRGVLAGVPDLPYLAAVGNHDLATNRGGSARANTATFLSYLDPEFSVDRMWYRKDVGRARLFFLDSSDLVYGDRGDREGDTAPPPGSRAERQLEWLARELDVGRAPGIATIVVMHHPFLQSSSRHRDEAAALWRYTYRGRALPDMLAEGGVDLVFCAHTHTCERFLLERDDGRRMMLVNLSGRPRSAAFGVGEGARRAHNLRGGEREYFTQYGWKGLDRWRISHEEAMPEEAEANQFGVVTVGADGSLLMDVTYLDASAPDGTRAGKAVWIR